MKTFLSHRSPTFALLTILLALAFDNSARACAASYGDTTGSKMGIAASWGIFAMVIIMFVMLGAVAGFGYYLAWRSKHPLPDYHELLSQNDGQPNPKIS